MLMLATFLWQFSSWTKCLDKCISSPYTYLKTCLGGHILGSKLNNKWERSFSVLAEKWHSLGTSTSVQIQKCRLGNGSLVMLIPEPFSWIWEKSMSKPCWACSSVNYRSQRLLHFLVMLTLFNSCRHSPPVLHFLQALS